MTPKRGSRTSSSAGLSAGPSAGLSAGPTAVLEFGEDMVSMNPGTHLASVYSDDLVLEKTATAFVRSGLAAGDRVLYVASDRSSAQVLAALGEAEIETETVVATGQFVINDFADLYGSGDFDLPSIAAGFRDVSAQSRSAGFPALRVAAEMGEFARALGSIDRLIQWERMASRLQQEEGISSVCQYDKRLLDEGQAELIAREHVALAPTHQRTPLASFFAMTEPFGMRITGELDLASHDALIRTLRAKSAVARDVHLDLQNLAFIDASSIAHIYRAANLLDPPGRIVLLNSSDRLRKLIRLGGFRSPKVAID